MRYFLIILTLLIATQSRADARSPAVIKSTAQTQAIAAIVNDDLITLQEFHARKKMIIVFNKIGNVDAAQAKMLNKAVLDGLIEEQLLFQEGNKFGIKVPDEEVKSAISGIEERNKMGKGQLNSQMISSGIDPATFKAKIKSEILKNKITSSSLSSGLTVSPSEIDAAVLDTNSKDAHISMKVITAKESSDKIYNKLIALSKKMPDSCDKLKPKSYEDIAEMMDVNAKLSQLDPQVQTVVKDLTAGDHSDVIKVGNDLKLILICSKKIENFTNDESNYVINFLGNKKLALKTLKYMEDMRKKAYIKVLI